MSLDTATNDERSARSRTYVVLCRPEDPRNVGAAIRAVANHGLAGVRLVAGATMTPRALDDFSAGALRHVRFQSFVNLTDAIADCHIVLGTSRRHVNPDAPPLWPAAGLAGKLSGTRSVAVLFGTERTGLTREELDRCQALIRIPTEQRFSSLNLAQAVACIGYELARPEPEDTHAAPRPAEPRLSSAVRDPFFDRMLRVMRELGYPPGKRPETFVRRVRRIIERADPTHDELSLLGGLVSELQRLWRVAKEVDLEGEQDNTETSEE